jgi:hypothetical protein
MSMGRLGREAALPREMQGRWVDADDASSELIVNGGEITCFGRPVEYDHKEIVEEDGALTISLRGDDEASEDAFQRANITGLVITPEGELHAYNVKFAARFVRTGS